MNLNEGVKNPLDNVAQGMINALAQWEAEHTPEKIREDVFNRLDKAQDEIVKKLLGFNQRWQDDKWELDHCNNRSGNSAAGDYLIARNNEVIKEWLAKVKIPTMTPAFRQKLEKDMQKRFEHELERKVWDIVQSAVSQAASQFKEQLIKTETVDRYFKMLSLIDNKD